MAAAQSGLSIGEFAGVIAACAAVVALGLGGVEYRLRRAKRRMDNAQRDARQEAEKRAMVSLVLERGLAATNNTLDFMAGLIQRLYQDRDREVALDESLRLLSELRAGVERSWAEARVMAGQETAQLSALQQLTNRLGDEGTRRLFERGASAGSFGTIESSTLLSAAEDIQTRHVDEEGTASLHDDDDVHTR